MKSGTVVRAFVAQHMKTGQILRKHFERLTTARAHDVLLDRLFRAKNTDSQLRDDAITVAASR
jgi:hypothetical protein